MKTKITLIILCFILAFSLVGCMDMFHFSNTDVYKAPETETASSTGIANITNGLTSEPSDGSTPANGFTQGADTQSPAPSLSGASLSSNRNQMSIITPIPTNASKTQSKVGPNQPYVVTPSPAVRSTPKPNTKSTPRPVSKSTPKPSSGFSWDKGGNYTGNISVKLAKTGNKSKSDANAVLDYSYIDQGYIMVKKSSSAKTKIRVVHGNQTYQRYTILDKNVYYPIPLQLGNGTYTVTVFTNISGNQYVKDVEETFSVSLASSSVNYEYNGIFCNYSNSSSAVRKGFGLAMNDHNNDLETVKSVYNYITSNIKYNYQRASNVSDSYIPNPDSILSSKSGICFDYSSLMATMLRAKGIPVKMVFGYTSKGEFHAWNEVYIRSKGEIAPGINSIGGWKRLDATFGVSMSASYLEKNSNYSPTEYY